MTASTPEPLPSPFSSTAAPVAWYRPSIRREVIRAWAQALTLVLAGALTLGLLRVERVDFGSPWLPLYIAGILLVMAGPLWLASRIARVMRHEAVLTLHADGLRWVLGEHVAAHLTWEAIERVDVLEAGLVVHAEGARLELPRTFEGITAEALAKVIEDLRRKSLMGLPIRPRIPDRT